MKVVDLTKEIFEGYEVYPGDPPVEIKRWATIKKEGYSVHKICLGTHTGTHIDAPSHMITNGKTLSDISLDRIIGRVVKFESNKKKIDVCDITPVIDKMPINRILVFDVPHGCYLTIKAAKRLVSRVRIKAVCFSDGALIDSGMNNGFPVHKIFLSAEIPIVTGLINVSKVRDNDLLIIAPLKIRGMDGSPCRVFVIQDI